MKLLKFLTLLLLAAKVTAAPAVMVRGLVTESSSEVILDLVADINPRIELRSFGLTVTYDPDVFAVSSMGRYDDLWFLSPDGGVTKLPYSDPAVLKPGLIELIGARFDGLAPDAGITGQQVMLGTLSFSRLKEGAPRFGFALARPEPFVNFAFKNGAPADENIAGLGDAPELAIQPPLIDEDDDGLPDPWELKIFGSIKESDGSGDHDGDGMSDHDEWLAGTDVLSADSKLTMTMTMQPDGSKVFEWNGQPGRIYTLERTGALTDFQPVVGALPGNVTQSVIESADSAKAAFYRLEVRRFP